MGSEMCIRDRRERRGARRADRDRKIHRRRRRPHRQAAQARRKAHLRARLVKQRPARLRDRDARQDAADRRVRRDVRLQIRRMPPRLKRQGPRLLHPAFAAGFYSDAVPASRTKSIEQRRRKSEADDLPRRPRLAWRPAKNDPNGRDVVGVPIKIPHNPREYHTLYSWLGRLARAL